MNSSTPKFKPSAFFSLDQGYYLDIHDKAFSVTEIKRQEGDSFNVLIIDGDAPNEPIFQSKVVLPRMLDSPYSIPRQQFNWRWFYDVNKKKVRAVILEEVLENEKPKIEKLNNVVKEKIKCEELIWAPGQQAPPEWRFDYEYYTQRKIKYTVVTIRKQ